MRGLVLLAAATAVGAVTACFGPDGFSCAGDSDCAGGSGEGVCEPIGVCSFPSEQCDSGRRYDTGGPADVAGQCVDDGATGSSGGGTSASTSTSGSSTAGTTAMPTTTTADTGGSGQTSIGGCPSGQMDCGGVCVDTDVDVDHCGACDAPCAGMCAAGTCIVAKVVFITSTRNSGDFGGLVGADAFCQQAAISANLTGTFMAWLSDSTGDPASRMTRNTGPYVLVNGTQLAANWDDLVDGMIDAPISLTEFGGAPPFSFICSGDEVWTNTTAAGTARSGDDCGQWSAPQGSTSSAGKRTEVGPRWTEDLCVSIACTSELSIYCVEQ